MPPTFASCTLRRCGGVDSSRSSYRSSPKRESQDTHTAGRHKTRREERPGQAAVPPVPQKRQERPVSCQSESRKSNGRTPNAMIDETKKTHHAMFLCRLPMPSSANSSSSPHTNKISPIATLAERLFMIYRKEAAFLVSCLVPSIFDPQKFRRRRHARRRRPRVYPQTTLTLAAPPTANVLGDLLSRRYEEAKGHCWPSDEKDGSLFVHLKHGKTLAAWRL